MPKGKIVLEGKNLLAASEKEMLKVRGSRISMIFQDPMTSLNPIISVGDQIGEMLTLHFKQLGKEEKEKIPMVSQN